MSLPSVAVVGGGVIGRTCALELARAGHAVTLVTAAAPEETTSSKAAALWRPFAAFPEDLVVDWSSRAHERLTPLTADPESGVRIVPGTEVQRSVEPDTAWLERVPDATVERNGDGHWVVRAAVPLIDMSRHLPWLRRRGAAAGVTEVSRRIGSVDEAAAIADLVVLATGLETNDLVPNAGMYPIQGQVVRVANPGGVEWFIDEHPDGVVYIIPRIDEVVVGGTEIVGAADTTIDPELERRIIARAAEVMPWIAEAPMTSRAVGLRPGRDAVRLERTGDVIHCYGRGGAGVTMAFGCAEDVVALAAG